MTNPETKIQTRIMLALSEADCIVWRNESALTWVGRVIHQQGDTVTLASARRLRAGLCTGSADLIGVHKPTGRMVAIEVKTGTGRPTPEQATFLEAVRAAGGIAGIARSPQEALDLLPKP